MVSPAEFVWKYLAGPVVADAKGAETAVWNGAVAETGYNIFNTASWALLAGIIGYVIYRWFKRNDIRFDRSTVIHSLPFVLLGGFLRFIEDSGALPFETRLLLVTPLIYFLIAGLYLGTLELAERYADDRDRILLLAGSAITAPAALYSFYLLLDSNIALLLQMIILAAALTMASYALLRNTSLDLPSYHTAVFSQFFGGAASMISVSQGYTQKQLLAQQATQVFGSAGILIVKAGVLAMAFYVLQDIEDERVEALLLLALIVVGLATGLRVALRVSAGI